MNIISLNSLNKISEGLKKGEEVWEITMRCADCVSTVAEERNMTCIYGKRANHVIGTYWLEQTFENIKKLNK